ncbi:MAG: bifunctional folylpolyglutamate synthase/dihydrofolate synthase [Acholeplasmataceae bacterium]
MSFKTHYEAIRWLESQTKFRPKTDLSIMQHAIKLLDLDLSKIQKVHVAGTNGKGSVSHYVKNILKRKGFKVGLFTSPYVYIFNERFMINDDMISHQELLDLTNFIQIFNLKMLEVYQESLSFFELLTVMSFKYFYDQKVDYMVIEVGIGGLLDATNVLNYDLSLITSIGFDHMKQLGNTLESIALNKLGILKKGNRLISTVRNDLYPLFQSYCDNLGVPFTYVDVDKDVLQHHMFPFDQRVSYEFGTFVLGMPGYEQSANALLALYAGKALFPNDPYSSMSEAISETKLPGRFEPFMPDPKIVLDGAHNEHAMKNLSQTIKAYHIGHRTHVIFSALGDKDIPLMLDILKPAVKSITLTAFDDPRYQSLLPYQTPDIGFEPDMIKLIRDLRKNHSSDYVIVTGSIHFIGTFKKALIRDKSKSGGTFVEKNKQSS